MRLLIKTETINSFSFGFIAILGLSFWFFLAFPFENHNESYQWLSIFNNISFHDAITKKIEPVASFRPLGQGVAYLGYKLTGGLIYSVQLFNYIIAAIAWFLLSLFVKEKKLFSVTSLLIGGFFFSGYIYLFHLHGVFYSPVFLLLSVLLYCCSNGGEISDNDIGKIIILTFIFSVSIGLFHPYALLVFIAYLIGFMIEKLKVYTSKQYILSAAVLVLGSGLVLTIKAQAQQSITNESLIALITSYRMLEVHRLISIFSLLLSIITIASIEGLDKSLKTSSYIMLTIISLILIKYNLPVIIMWIFACIFKMVYLKKWAFSSLLITTFLLPAIAPSGSPTYAIYVLMVCAAALPFGWMTLENKIRFINNTTVLALYILCSVFIILLRSNTYVPVISPLVRPILAEREKTFQLASIINWVINSKYKDYEILFYQSKYDLNPINDPGQAINRTNRPPTSYQYLSMYLNSIRGTQTNSSNKLLVTFGDNEIKGMTLLKIINGTYAGKAMIFSWNPIS